MTNDNYTKLLGQVRKAQLAYFDLLSQAEQEYKRRYGCYPGDISDEGWIDTFELGRLKGADQQGMTAREVEESHRTYKACQRRAR